MALSYFSRKTAPLPDDQPESQAEIEEQLKAARNYGASIAEKPLLSDEGYTESSDPAAPTDNAGIGQSVLSDEDEQFLERVASAAEAAPLPFGDGEEAGEKPAVASTDDATNTPLPADATSEESNKRKSGWLPSMPQVPQMPQMPNLPAMPQGYGMNSLPSLPSFRRAGAPATKRQKSNDANSLPTTSTTDSEDTTAASANAEEQEKRNLTALLGRLDLSVSSLNNRVISLSAPSKKLLSDFNTIIKDIVNGAPTAYDDLEKFLTQRQGQIEGLYESMPPFLQGLVSSLPMRMAAGLGPQVAAAAGASFGGGGNAKTSNAAPKQSQGSTEKGKRPAPSYVPSLKSLISQQGMVASMLRSIMSFLESRFPMLLGGTNVLMSLALFLLMFVFYYCHKRGRETRIAQEGLQSDIESANEDTLKRYREAQAQAQATQAQPGAPATSAGTDDELAAVEENGATDASFAETEEKQPRVATEGTTVLAEEPNAVYEKTGGGEEAAKEARESPKIGRVPTNPGSL